MLQAEKTAFQTSSKNSKKVSVVPLEAEPETNPKKPETATDKQASENFNFEETNHHLNELWELQTKYNKLQASKQKLAEFKFNTNGTDDIGLSIGNGVYREDFATKNPEIVEAVVKFITSLINTKSNEIKNKIRW